VPEDEIERIVGVAADAPEEPELDPDNIEYFRVFFDIAESRPPGFGAAAVPLSEIAVYWDRSGFDDFLTFSRRIRAADNALLAWNREREQRKRRGG
jgi:hypothetical protein